LIFAKAHLAGEPVEHVARFHLVPAREQKRGNRNEDAGDFEPSLGSYNVIPGRSMAGSAVWPEQVQVTDQGFDQSGWAYGGTDDLEDEHDGREDGGDDEDGGDREPDHDNEGTERIPGGGP
jgi:hypothetical protein